MKVATIRLNTKELMKAQIDADIKSDKELARLIGVSPTQVWRAKLKPTDPQYNAPGPKFIAGILSLFEGEKFERFFYIEVKEVEKDDVRKLGS